jgi:hypothetical protein
MKLQKIGGYSAIISLCVYIAIVIFVNLLLKRLGGVIKPVKEMAAWSATSTICYMSGLTCIIVNILRLIVFFALHERMQTNAPHLTRYRQSRRASAVSSHIRNINWEAGESF